MNVDRLISVQVHHHRALGGADPESGERDAINE
jgi:hypothetical protein